MSRRGEPPLSERQRYILSGAVHDCEEASARPIDAVANAGEAPSPSAADPISRKAWADSAVDLDGWTAPLFDEFQLISLSEEIERTNGGQISIRVRTELYEPRYIAPWAHGLADRKVDFLTRSQLMTFEVDWTRHLARLTELRNYPRRNLKGSPARGYSGGYQGTPAPFSDARLPPALFQRACARAAST